MEESNWYVYRHLKPNGEVFYIGIGKTKNFKRAYSKHGRTKWWENKVNKYPNYEVQILAKNISLEEANEIEIVLISWYKRIDCCGGTLVNMNDGGTEGNNWIPDEEWRKNKSQAVKGENNPNFGNKWSEEQKEVARKRMVGKYTGENNPMYGVKRESPFKGRKHSEETLRLLKRPKTKNLSRRIILNTETGVFYFGVKDAFNTQNIYKSLSNFTSVLNGKYRNKSSFVYC